MCDSAPDFIEPVDPMEEINAMIPPIDARPAARFFDATFHGGAILWGDFTVLIGGRPAARKGDIHGCPVVDGVKPHVGGVITQGSSTVQIGNADAARMFDLVGCNIFGCSGSGSPAVISPDVTYHVTHSDGEVASYTAAELLDGQLKVGNVQIETDDWRSVADVSLWSAEGEADDADGDTADLKFHSVHGQLRGGLLIGHDGKNSWGLGAAAGASLSFIDGKVNLSRKPVPVLDWALDFVGLEAEYKAGGRAAFGPGGAHGDGHAYYNSESEEFYLGGLLAVFGVGGEFDLIIGGDEEIEQTAPGPQGVGVGGIPNLVSAGKETVIIGGLP